ncbi:MAG: DNA-processing protein DprA [Erysipelotrichaceae bacterium]|nr:DNA-processing protein DprA [Erysipelotrichaceae bacterium]
MGNREKLIGLAYKYQGKYFRILKAIKNNEEIDEINDDNCLTIFDDDYPLELRQLRYPPFVLFYKGNLDLLKKEKIGIVGSRIPCEYSLKATELLVKNNMDKIIVSGLAKGIDGKAHDVSDYSIGILGCGINYVYPLENLKLFEKLQTQGLILSEYPDNTKPLSYHFPFRNRIIAALSNVVYVMQSSERSGTVTTINEALELQKEVKVLPFSIFDEQGVYNNKLINDGALILEANELKIDNLK